ncbi:hypothetical protein CDA63_01725 [Hymenobacter amundsenii]|uniref:DUF8201 domain-containing protein n=1 Tax=Hymenobacter amundsenii TaxID=2006685 RepID=A0A246FQV4_9BACT|nr:hypothetical protein [Hymenobacter amundsenii]OWP65100.1 hypothetical protein CDA63_01725 [Hymenobacter amundsenii]
MLLVLAGWLLLALTTTTIGWTAWRGLTARYPTAPALPFELLSLSGIALLLAVLAPLSLVLPIGPAVQAALGFGVAALLLGQRRALVAAAGHWKTTVTWASAAWWAGAALLGLLGLNLLLRDQAGSRNPDAQLYYLQTLQWITDYPAVPGLGNLHGRLAFNSHLFLVTALFRLPTPTGNYYPLPPYLATLLAVAAVRGLVRGLTGPARSRTGWALAGLVLFFVFLYLFQTWLASPAPDYVLVVWLCLLLLFYSRFFGPYPIRGRADRPVLLLLVLLSCVAVTIKLSALPILLLPVHALWVAGRRGDTGSLRRWVGPAALAGLLLLPWVGRNLVLSGYPVYPLVGLPGLPVDWKMPAALVQTEQRLIINMARQMAPADWYGPVAAHWQQWLPAWWQQQISQPAVALPLLLAAIAPLVVGWRIWRRPALGQTAASPGWLSAWLVAVAGSAFWLLLAPDYRFGLGFLLLMAGGPWFSLPASRRVIWLMLVLGAAGALHLLREPVYGLRHPIPGAVSAVVWPVLPPLPPTVIQRLPDGQLVHVAQAQGACGETALPCTHAIEPGLERRGESLGQGFRIRPTAQPSH